MTAAEQWKQLEEALEKQVPSVKGVPQLKEVMRICFYAGTEFGMTTLQKLAEQTDTAGIQNLCCEVTEGLKWKL